VNGAEFIKIYHEKIKVGASISMINGFSAHADQTELLDWINQFEKLEKVFLIHGEPDKQSKVKKFGFNHPDYLQNPKGCNQHGRCNHQPHFHIITPTDFNPFLSQNM